MKSHTLKQRFTKKNLKSIKTLPILEKTKNARLIPEIFILRACETTRSITKPLI